MFQSSHFRKTAKELAMDPLSYEKEYNNFLAKLKKFHDSKGSPFRRLPWLGGQFLDLYLLYKKVTSYGGWIKVTEDKKWRDIAEVFNLPSTCTNAAFALRQHYARYLETYERINFFGEDVEDVISTGRPHTPISVLPGAGPSEYPSPSTVVDVTRNFEKLVLSLQCGLPNEVDFGINICMLLSNVNNSVFNLNKAPAIIDMLLGHVGVYVEDSHGLKDVYNEWYQKTERDFIKFWKETLEIEEFRDLFCGGQDKNEDNEEQLFNPGKKYGVNSVESQRVAQVCMILYNFSFDDTNAEILASHSTCLRFLMLCICNQMGYLQSLAWNTLSNLAEKMKLDPVEAKNTQIVFQILHYFLDDKDRFKVIKAMDILGKLCIREDNDEVIESALEIPGYESLVRILIIPDVQLVIGSLEALYNISGVGQSTSDQIASVDHSVDILVCMVTLDVEFLGPQALSEVTVIENRLPGSLPMTPRPRPTHASPVGAPSSPSSVSPHTPVSSRNEVDAESFTLKWLQATYEAIPTGTVSRIDLYADYLSSCSRLARIGILNASSFNRIVKFVFPDAQLRRFPSGNQLQYALFGIRRRANPLTVHSAVDQHMSPTPPPQVLGSPASNTQSRGIGGPGGGFHPDASRTPTPPTPGRNSPNWNKAVPQRPVPQGIPTTRQTSPSPSGQFSDPRSVQNGGFNQGNLIQKTPTAVRQPSLPGQDTPKVQQQSVGPPPVTTGQMIRTPGQLQQQSVHPRPVFSVQNQVSMQQQSVQTGAVKNALQQAGSINQAAMPQMGQTHWQQAAGASQGATFQGNPRQPMQQNQMSLQKVTSVNNQSSAQNIQGQVVRGQIVPGQSMEGQAMQGQGIQGQAMQGQGIQDQSMQGQALLGQAMQLQAVQGQVVQGQAEQGQAVQGQAVQGQVVQGQAVQGQVVQGQAVQGQAVQGQVVQGQVVQGQVVQGQAVQGQVVQVQPMQRQAMQGQTMQVQTMQVQAMQGQAMQAMPGQTMQGQAVQGQPVRGQPVQGQPVQGQAMQVQAMQTQSMPTQAQAFQRTMQGASPTPASIQPRPSQMPAPGVMIQNSQRPSINNIMQRPGSPGVSQRIAPRPNLFSQHQQGLVPIRPAPPVSVQSPSPSSSQPGPGHNERPHNGPPPMGTQRPYQFRPQRPTQGQEMQRFPQAAGGVFQQVHRLPSQDPNSRGPSQGFLGRPRLPQPQIAPNQERPQFQGTGGFPVRNNGPVAIAPKPVASPSVSTAIDNQPGSTDGVVLIAREEKAEDILSSDILKNAEEQRIIVVENTNNIKNKMNSTKSATNHQTSIPCENDLSGHQGTKRDYKTRQPVANLNSEGLIAPDQVDHNGHDSCLNDPKRIRLDKTNATSNNIEDSPSLHCTTEEPSALVNGDIRNESRNKLMDKLLGKDLHMPLNGVCDINATDLDLMATEGERLSGSNSKTSSPDLFDSENNSDFGKYLEESDTDTGLFSDVILGDLRIEETDPRSKVNEQQKGIPSLPDLGYHAVAQELRNPMSIPVGAPSNDAPLGFSKGPNSLPDKVPITAVSTIRPQQQRAPGPNEIVLGRYGNQPDGFQGRPQLPNNDGRSSSSWNGSVRPAYPPSYYSSIQTPSSTPQNTRQPAQQQLSAILEHRTKALATPRMPVTEPQENRQQFAPQPQTPFSKPNDTPTPGSPGTNPIPGCPGVPVSTSSTPPVEGGTQMPRTAMGSPPVETFKPFRCKWANCTSSFDGSKQLFGHVVTSHVPRDSLVMTCLWENCVPVRRSRSSLLFHLQQKHSGPTPVNSSPNPQPQTPQPPAPPTQQPNPNYLPAYRLLARMINALQEEEESPLTKTIRLTSALVLRNIAQYSAVARSHLRRHERLLSEVAMSSSEAAHAIAACLSELSPHRKTTEDSSNTFIWAFDR